MRILRGILEMVAGAVMGVFLAHFFLYYGFLSEDELQKQVSQKAKCQTYEEHLSFLDDPHERFSFVEKHKKILAECEKEDTN